MNTCHSQTHSLGKVTATEAVLAFGTSDVYCSLGLRGANGEMVYGQNQPLQGCLLDGNLWCGQI